MEIFTPKPTLTSREREVLKLAAIGHSRKEIADKMNISTGTVDTYFKRLYIKIEAHSMAETAIWALKNGYG